jgi:hypothetical protein
LTGARETSFDAYPALDGFFYFGCLISNLARRMALGRNILKPRMKTNLTLQHLNPSLLHQP